MGSSLIMNEDHNNQDGDDLDLVPSSSSDVSSDSTSSDLIEDATSPSSSFSSSDHHRVLSTGGPLDEMSSLMQQLPFKRGLSKFFQGKSQSFTSLSNVRCLEDLAKPENPYNKRLKSCKSYGGLLMSEETDNNNKASSPTPKAFTRAIAKKSSRGSCSASSLSAKRSNSFLGNNRPPIPPQKPSALCNQTPLFV